jgi:hypothetical protein
MACVLIVSYSLMWRCVVLLALSSSVSSWSCLGLGLVLFLFHSGCWFVVYRQRQRQARHHKKSFHMHGSPLSCLVLSCLVLPLFLLSLAFSGMVSSAVVRSYLILSCLVLSGLILSVLVPSCLVLSCLVVSCF